MIARFIVSAVVGGIVFFVLGFLLYGMLLDPWMRANVTQYPGLMKEVPDMVPLAGMNLVWAASIAFVADNWANARDFGSGMKVGGILMFFASIAVNLSFTAFMNMFQNLLVPVVDSITWTFIGVVSGGVIGIVLGKMKKD